MKSWLFCYIAVILAVLVLSLVYLSQRNTILNQGYEIGSLKCSIEQMKRANVQISGEIQALKRPDRCWGVLGDRMAQFDRVNRQVEIPSCGGEIPTVASNR